MKAFLLKCWHFTLKYPFAVIGTVLLVAFAVLAIIFGQKIQIGGLLGLLWGKKDGIDPNIRVLPPPDRVDKDGKPIPAGVSDDKGWTQAPVNVVLKDPGIFSDPNVLVITHPDKGEVKIPLPEGVKNADVKQVVEVAPNVYQIRNNDKGSDAGKLLEDLDK
jgi:hypothetical protein